MKIYLVGPEKEYLYSVEELNKVGNVVYVNNLSEIFSDPDDKILGIAPGVIDWKFPLEDLKKIQNLKGICTKSSWGFYIDIEYCRQNNIHVCNVPGANSRSVAEYAFWMMLSLARKLPQQIRDSFQIHESDNLHVEISDKKIGIIGLGKVGGHLAKMAQGFGMEVWYSGRSPKKNSYKYSPVEDLLKNCDFIFDCLENCPETQNYLNKDRLSLMKSSAYFISVMGGAGWGVEDDEFLVQMVQNNKLAGFSIENEHKGNFPKKFDGNIFIPPAYAWKTVEAQDRTNKIFTETIVGLATGKVINVIK
ncbi:MAG: NAD(P)-dependent oxidoreductase [Microgenomates group bacterium]